MNSLGIPAFYNGFMFSRSFSVYNSLRRLTRCRFVFFDILSLFNYSSCQSFIKFPLTLSGISFQTFIFFSFFGHSFPPCSPLTLSTFAYYSRSLNSMLSHSLRHYFGLLSIISVTAPLTTTLTSLLCQLVSWATALSDARHRSLFRSYSAFQSIFFISIHRHSFNNTQSLISSKVTLMDYVLRHARSLIVLSLLDTCFRSLRSLLSFHHTFFWPSD
jgi:hypothetical protein